MDGGSFESNGRNKPCFPSKMLTDEETTETRQLVQLAIKRGWIIPPKDETARADEQRGQDEADEVISRQSQAASA
jgi:hypothetical protein